MTIKEMFRILALVVFSLQALAIPFANGREVSVCSGEKAAKIHGGSCCGSECSSGCCSVKADTAKSQTASRTCCGTHSHQAPGKHSQSSGCGGTCTGCACCFALTMPVAVTTAGEGLQTCRMVSAVVLRNDSALGLTLEPSVPPPIAA